MKQTKLIYLVLLGLFLTPVLVNGQLSTTTTTKTIEIGPTETITYKCPQILVNCVQGTVPQSYIGDDGCTKWKCIPQADKCPAELVNCAKGTVPQSYIGDDGCTKWKCIPQAEECPTGCICQGDVIACPITGIKPIEAKISSKSGTKTVSIKKVPNGLSLKSEKATAITTEKLVIEEDKLSLKTSTGNKEIKILPEEASSKATAATNVNTIELKEESQQPIYSVKGTKQAKLLFVIPVSIQIETKVSAESGNVISVKKPWWSFLAW